QKELEIVPDQLAKLTKLREENQTEMHEAFQRLTKFPPEEHQDRYREIMQELGAETEKKVLDVLLPQQVRRLKQIVLQTKLSQAGYGHGLSAVFGTEQLAKELDITPEQLEEFKKKEEEIRKDVQEKTKAFYKKLNDDAHTKIMQVLTPEQRAKLAAL